MSFISSQGVNFDSTFLRDEPPAWCEETMECTYLDLACVILFNSLQDNTITQFSAFNSDTFQYIILSER
jgi:hypothetical protein